MIKRQTRMKSLIAVLRTEDFAREIVAYCDAATDISADIRIEQSTLAAAPALINGGADVVIIETGAAGADEIAALEQLCAYVARGGSFIAIMENPSAEAIRRLFRAGVTDVLPAPPSPAEITAALDAARGRAAPVQTSDPGASGKIVTVVKAAGGVGATTVALNMGAAFASAQHGRVIVTDLDIQFGQAATALDIAPRMSVLDAVRAGARLDAVLLSSILHEHDSGLRLLPAPGTTTPLDAIDSEFIGRLFKTLRATCALAIIEIPAAWTQWTGEAIEKSDLVIVVAEANVRSAAGAARIAQSLVDFGLAEVSPAVVMNKFEKTIENGERARRIGEIFQTKPLAAVRQDAKAAAECSDRGLLFAEAAPKSAITTDFASLARRVANALGIELETTPRAAPFDRLLSGRFGIGSRPQ